MVETIGFGTFDFAAPPAVDAATDRSGRDTGLEPGEADLGF